jgi:hypothetical protein
MKKNSINELRDLIRSYVVKALREAEEEEAPKDDAPADDAGGEEEGGGENPFAAGGDDAAAGGEEGGEEAGAEGGEEGDEEEGGAKAAPQKDVPTIEFDFSAVKRYNPNTQFLGSEGQVIKVTKRGLIVNVLPDNVQVVVNFDDIKNNQ